MNCDEFQNIVTELAREQMMEASARKQALAHATRCDDCALRLENERQLTKGLRSLAQQMKSLEAGPVVEARLLAAFRSRSAVAPVIVRSRRWYWVGAAAAAVLLVFGVVAIRGRMTSIAAPQKSEATNLPPATAAPTNEDRAAPSPAPREPEVVNNLDSPRYAPRFAGLGRKGPRAVPALVSNAANNEIATEFFPVGDGSAANLQDGGQLMRVELPRSTMVRFGLPVNTERANERVKADVLVSTDGLARAIRFVQ